MRRAVILGCSKLSLVIDDMPWLNPSILMSASDKTHHFYTELM